MDASLDSIFSDCTASDCEKLLSQLHKLLARTDCDAGSFCTDHRGTAQFTFRNVTKPIKRTRSIPGLEMSLQVDDIRKGNVIRIRIVTDVKAPFLAIVSVNGTSYCLKHCNGGSKASDFTNCADNLFKMEDRKADIFVSIVPSSIQLLKECLEERCSPQEEPQAPTAPSAHQLAYHEPLSTANNRQRRNKSPIGNRRCKCFLPTSTLMLAMFVVAAGYTLYSIWADLRRMAVRSVTPDWPTSLPLQEKAKMVLYGLYFLYRDVWTLLKRRGRISERQLRFLMALDAKVSKRMSLYIKTQSVTVSNELHPCPLVCKPEICRKDCVLIYKGGEIEADLERLIRLTEGTMHLADSLLFQPKDWEDRTSEFDRASGGTWPVRRMVSDDAESTTTTLTSMTRNPSLQRSPEPFATPLSSFIYASVTSAFFLT